MKIIGYIQRKKTLITGFVITSLLGFLAINFGSGLLELYFMRSPSVCVATMAGHKVDMYTYQSLFNKMKMQYIRRYGNKTHVDVAVHNEVWKHFIEKYVYGRICDTIHIVVPPEEQVDIIQGHHVREELRMAFVDPKTGKLDKEKMLTQFREMVRTPQGRAMFQEMEKQFILGRRMEKFFYILGEMRQTTPVEAYENQRFGAEATIDVRYLYIPYSSISDEFTQVTSQQAEAYLKEHRKDYTVEQERSISYVMFLLTPSEEDVTKFHSALQEVIQGFKKTSHPINFARHHTDGEGDITTTWTESTMPSFLRKRCKKMKKGSIFGPVAAGGNLYVIGRFIKCTRDWRGKRHYKFAILSKELRASQVTKEKLLLQAKEFAQGIKTLKDWNKKAERKNLHTNSLVIPLNRVRAELGYDTNTKELFRWLYKDAKRYKVSPPIEMPNGYLVAIMTDEQRGGDVNLEVKDIKKDIYRKLKNEQKGQKIINKLQPIMERGLPLNKVASTYGKSATVHTCRELSFQKDVLPSVGIAYEAIGAAFGLQVGQRTGVILGEKGVFIVERLKSSKQRRCNIALDEIEKKLVVKVRQEYLKEVIKLIIERANISDNRYLIS